LGKKGVEQCIAVKSVHICTGVWIITTNTDAIDDENDLPMLAGNSEWKTESAVGISGLGPCNLNL
jgi:hypothetical protein